MRVPFRKLIDDTFRSDGSLWLKIGGAAFVCCFIVVAGTLKFFRQENLPLDELRIKILLALGLAALPLGAFLAFALSFKDTIERKIEFGQKVHLALNLLFGMRAQSLLIWFTLALLSPLLLLLSPILVAAGLIYLIIKRFISKKPS